MQQLCFYYTWYFMVLRLKVVMMNVSFFFFFLNLNQLTEDV